MENIRILFAEASSGEIKKLVDNSAQRNTKKIHKIYRNDLCAFALRNYSEGYKMNKPLSGLLVHRRIMPSAERLSSKFHSCPRSFASRPYCSFFGQYFNRGHYPPIYQPLKVVYLLHVYMYIYIVTYIYCCNTK